MAILKVVGFLVNFCSCSSFQTFGKAKYGNFLTCSVLANGMYRSSALRSSRFSSLSAFVVHVLCREGGGSIYGRWTDGVYK